MSDIQGFEEKDYSREFNAGIWKKIIKMARPVYPFIAGTGCLMVMLAVMDAALPQLLRYAVDVLVPAVMEKGMAGVGGRVTAFVVGCIALATVQGLCVFSFILTAGIIEVRLVHILRQKAFDQLQELSFSYYDKTPAGWIMSRMTSDAQKLGDTIAWGIVDLVWGFAIMTAVVVCMFVMNWRMALFALAFMPVLIFMTWWFQSRILDAQRKARKAGSLLSGMYNEGLQGARTSKTLVLEEYNRREFEASSATLKGHAMKAARMSSLFMPLVILLAAIGAAMALGKGGTMVIGGTLSFGTLIAFVNYSMMLFDPAREVARVLSEFQAAQASAERLVGLIETSPEIVDSPNANDEGEIQGDVELSHVDFGYAKGDFVFRDFSLKIPAGQTLAIVGETGSGKSSLVNLMCRFYEPSAGEILIDGKDYRTRTRHWLHSKLGYVLQTPLLFSGTVRENIRYGMLAATDSEIEDAARQANAFGFISRLDQGFDTLVGEGGALLSTGQKQLISLARALVANPRIMVLDEATSSVDTETEVLIQGAIERLLEGRTSIVIAHRLSTIRNADRILVMENGTVLEDGNHERLMEARGRYWRLYTRQFLDEEALVLVSSEESPR